ncbi:IS21-like element helper ATPase IstB [Nocardia australiensis]|uniref:IS21-like element helper ATPase IstB n=1 Tax=Nocardia australiensis TaxID=2887191 RepID=UPI00272EA0EB|nr:IS21-like element helper ATPase IstB [Nocardia australiensis]
MSEMSKVELYAAIRQDLRAGLSMRAIERKHRVGWRTVASATESVWPEPRKEYPPRPQKLDPYKPFIDDVLRADLDVPRRQRHTATRIYHRLLEEHGMRNVSYQRVSAYVRERKPQLQAQQLTARRRSERLIEAAGFPRSKTLRDFDFGANPSVDPAMIRTLAESDWVKEGLPLCLIGDSGTGKSHLLIALGTEAAKAGYRVRYTLAARLVNRLIEAVDGKRLTKTIAHYSGVDLLCIDELGYTELDRRGAELLFQVLTEREERTSVAIVSNRSFAGWSKIFTDAALCAAIIDRLTFGGNIIETGTQSYRWAHAKATEPTDKTR